MYKYIFCPIKKNRININSSKGKKILKKYITYLIAGTHPDPKNTNITLLTDKFKFTFGKNVDESGPVSSSSSPQEMVKRELLHLMEGEEYETEWTQSEEEEINRLLKDARNILGRLKHLSVTVRNDAINELKNNYPLLYKKRINRSNDLMQLRRQMRIKNLRLLESDDFKDHLENMDIPEPLTDIKPLIKTD